MKKPDMYYPLLLLAALTLVTGWSGCGGELAADPDGPSRETMEADGALAEGASPKYFTNLLQNPDAETGDLSGWKVTENSGEGWTVSGAAGSRVFRTSYLWNRREQLVDLWAHGFDSTIMEEAPIIFVSEQFQRQYCPDDYSLEVELLDFQLQVVASWSSGVRRNSGECKWGDEVWEGLSHTFRDYGPGVRYVRFRDAGKDSELWGGHYGVKMDNARVVVLDHDHPAFFSNLLSNPDAETGDLSGWKLTENGGEGWAVSGDAGSRVFRTSYAWNRRVQFLDLWKFGFDPETMAQAPLIVLGEDFQRQYCPDRYYLKVQLLDEQMNVVAAYDSGERTNTGACDWNSKEWDKLNHAFADYGPGVRYVRWEDGGADTERWAGRYGVKLDNAYLAVLGPNLLANPGAGTGDLSGWNLLANGGEGWAVSPAPRDGISGNQAFRTSYVWNRRSQLVDLLAHGYPEEVLDASPPLYVSESFRRQYCPDQYYLKVDLLDASQQVITSFDSGILTNTGACEWGNEQWDRVFHIFLDYGPGVRFVRWEDGGRDSEFWGGRYGPILDGAYLGLEDPDPEARHQSHKRSIFSWDSCGGEDEPTCKHTDSGWYSCYVFFACHYSRTYYGCDAGYAASKASRASEPGICHLDRSSWKEKALDTIESSCQWNADWPEGMNCWEYDDKIRDKLNMDNTQLNHVTVLEKGNAPRPGDGRYIYVYRKQDNKLWLRRYDRGDAYAQYQYPANVRGPKYLHVRHSQLNGGWTPVWCAGEMYVKNGMVCRLNNASGHYKPPEQCLTYVETTLRAWDVPRHPFYMKGSFDQVEADNCSPVHDEP